MKKHILILLGFVCALLLSEKSVFCNDIEDLLLNNDGQTKVLQSFVYLISSWGYDEMKSEHTGRRQYLVATAVSKMEIEEWKTLPEKFLETTEMKRIYDNGRKPETITCPRRIVFLQNDESQSRGKHQRELHGEIQLLNNGYLDHLLRYYYEDNPKTSKTTTKPLLIIWSFYIPCANEESCVGEYSCAKTLAEFAQNNLVYSEIAVFYQEVFKRSTQGEKGSVQDTEEKLALQYMRGKGITCLKTIYNANTRGITLQPYYPGCQDQKEANKRKIDDLDSNGQKPKKTRKTRSVYDCPLSIIQDYMYDCFVRLPLIHCCTWQRNKHEIAAFSVNHALHYCTSNSTFLGRLNHMSRDYLRACLRGWVGAKIGGDCSRCSDRSSDYITSTRLLFKTCTDGAVNLSDVIGTPSVGFNVVNPRWEALWTSWSGAYREPPDNFLSRYSLPCGVGTLDPAGLCTQLTV